jgi:hypothetical protein
MTPSGASSMHLPSAYRFNKVGLGTFFSLMIVPHFPALVLVGGRADVDPSHARAERYFALWLVVIASSIPPRMNMSPPIESVQ